MPSFIVVTTSSLQLEICTTCLALKLPGVWIFGLLPLLISCILLNTTEKDKGFLNEMFWQYSHLFKRIFFCLRQHSISAAYLSRYSFFRLTRKEKRKKKKKKMEKRSYVVRHLFIYSRNALVYLCNCFQLSTKKTGKLQGDKNFWSLNSSSLYFKSSILYSKVILLLKKCSKNMKILKNYIIWGLFMSKKSYFLSGFNTIQKK